MERQKCPRFLGVLIRSWMSRDALGNGGRNRTGLWEWLNLAVYREWYLQNAVNYTVKIARLAANMCERGDKHIPTSLVWGQYIERPPDIR